MIDSIINKCELDFKEEYKLGLSKLVAEHLLNTRLIAHVQSGKIDKFHQTDLPIIKLLKKPL